MLIVNEIYNTVSGEAGGFPPGSICKLVRFQGCNLRCSYCDTPISRMIAGPNESKVQMPATKEVKLGTDQPYFTSEVELQFYSPAELASLLMKEPRRLNRILLTGGEPLIQDRDSLRDLLRLLRGCHVQIETNGSLNFEDLRYDWCSWVIDRKMPSSGMYEENVDQERMASYLIWGDRNVAKYVVCNWHDVEAALDDMEKIIERDGFFEHRLLNRPIPPFSISPVNGTSPGYSYAFNYLLEMVQERDLANYISLNPQLHKLIDMP